MPFEQCYFKQESINLGYEVNKAWKEFVQLVLFNCELFTVQLSLFNMKCSILNVQFKMFNLKCSIQNV